MTSEAAAKGRVFTAKDPAVADRGNKHLPSLPISYVILVMLLILVKIFSSASLLIMQLLNLMQAHM